ncbi:hypothetical protein K474DRAFT_458200 [Panus rudis PR-1116 ss-1]|nr:hypothetical protein K474DRAFT_458200 [Panus rudis PR-1116 ss-1]
MHSKINVAVLLTLCAATSSVLAYPTDPSNVYSRRNEAATPMLSHSDSVDTADESGASVGSVLSDIASIFFRRDEEGVLLSRDELERRNELAEFITRAVEEDDESGAGIFGDIGHIVGKVVPIIGDIFGGNSSPAPQPAAPQPQASAAPVVAHRRAYDDNDMRRDDVYNVPARRELERPQRRKFKLLTGLGTTIGTILPGLIGAATAPVAPPVPVPQPVAPAAPAATQPVSASPVAVPSAAGQPQASASAPAAQRRWYNNDMLNQKRDDLYDVLARRELLAHLSRAAESSLLGRDYR